MSSISVFMNLYELYTLLLLQDQVFFFSSFTSERMKDAFVVFPALELVSTPTR